jgi:hypothetical protein
MPPSLAEESAATGAWSTDRDSRVSSYSSASTRLIDTPGAWHGPARVRRRPEA